MFKTLMMLAMGPLVTLAICAHAEQPRLLQLGTPMLTQEIDDGTWNGYLNVHASPCKGGPVIETNMTFANVKTADDVFDKLKEKLAVAEKEAERIDSQCNK